MDKGHGRQHKMQKQGDDSKGPRGRGGDDPLSVLIRRVLAEHRAGLYRDQRNSVEKRRGEQKEEPAKAPQEPLESPAVQSEYDDLQEIYDATS